VRLGSIGRSKVQPQPHPDDDELARLREARLGHARANPRWTELEDSRLVARSPGLFVDAESDAAYKSWAGVLYARGEVASAYGEFSEVYFYVDRDGVMQFLERLPFTGQSRSRSASGARRGRRRHKAVQLPLRAEWR
jgi:hypothetical protein